MLTRALDRLRREERGASLIEMVMAMAAGMITVAVTLSLVVDSQSAANRVTQRVDATQRGRTAMNQMLQALRAQVCLAPGGETIAAGEDTRVRFYADLQAAVPPRPELRELRWTGGTLWEDRWVNTVAAPAIAWAAQPSSRALAERIARPTGADRSIFRFWGFDGTGTNGAFVRLPTPLSAADRTRVVKVEVAFRSLSGTTTASDIALAGSVYARTADAGNPSAGASCA